MSIFVIQDQRINDIVSTPIFESPPRIKAPHFYEYLYLFCFVAFQAAGKGMMNPSEQCMASAMHGSRARNGEHSPPYLCLPFLLAARPPPCPRGNETGADAEEVEGEEEELVEGRGVDTPGTMGWSRGVLTTHQRPYP